jgi:hypothetical protein
MLDDAVKRWTTFHKKPKHRKLIDVKLSWPKRWGRIGEAKTTYYESDKWYRDGEYVKYYHDHDRGVICYHPIGTQKGLVAAKPKVTKWPDAAAVLGKFLGWDIETDEGLCEAEPDAKTSLLCSSPDGHMLFVVEKGKITGLLVGPSLRVEAEGIDG